MWIRLYGRMGGWVGVDRFKAGTNCSLSVCKSLAQVESSKSPPCRLALLHASIIPFLSSATLSTPAGMEASTQAGIRSNSLASSCLCFMNGTGWNRLDLTWIDVVLLRKEGSKEWNAPSYWQWLVLSLSSCSRPCRGFGCYGVERESIIDSY